MQDKTEVIEKTDQWISFEHTDHDNLYDNPFILKLEDIFGFMVAYRKPWNKATRKSMKNYRNRLTNWCRDNCTRFPSDCENVNGDDTCRVFYLKCAYTREIRGPKVRIRGGVVSIEVQ